MRSFSMMSLLPRLRRFLLSTALRAWPRRFRHRHDRALRQTLEADWQAEATTRPPSRRRWRRSALVAEAIGAGLRERASEGVNGLNDRDRRSAVRAVGTDLRSAVRGLQARPVFTAAVVGTLGLGLGATTAIFAVVDAVVLRPLPYPADHELVRVTEVEPSRNLSAVSVPALLAWRELPEIAYLAAYEAQPMVFAQGGVPERVMGVSVSPDFFTLLGIDAAIGESFRPDEPLFDPAPRLVLGHDLWQRRFAADPGVVGRTIILEERPYEIVGLMPPGFAFPAGAEFWRTLPASMEQIAGAPGLRFLQVVGRLAPGADLGQLRTRLAAWKSAHPDEDEPWTVSARSLREEARGGVEQALATVFAGVGLLLLVACANVMALLLANGRARAGELATRAALGATRSRLTRQLLLEGMLLSIGAVGVALVATRAARAVIVELSADQIPRIADLSVGVNVVAFSVIAGLVSAFIVAFWPAWVLTRRAVGTNLTRLGSRSVAGSQRGRAWFGGLVAVEFALALVLVAGAALLLGSYRQLAAVDTGTSTDRIGVVGVVLPLTPEWRSRERQYQLAADLTNRVRTLPGVDAAALVSRLPLGEARGGVDVSPLVGPDTTVRALLTSTTPGYFETVGAALVAGRDFSVSDHADAERVVILNQVAASQLFGSAAEAVGRQLTYEFMLGTEVARVVGVTRPIRYEGLTAALTPEMVVPATQSVALPMTLVYRTTGDPTTLVPSVRAVLSDVDPTSTAVLSGASTLGALHADQVARPRFFLVLFGVFAVLAFVLAACGIYGTTAYWLAESRRELGLRLALGATPRQLVVMLTSRGGRIALLGIVIGLALALMGNRFIAHLLFAVEPTDPAILAGASFALVVGGGAACWLPARRVFRIDPAEIIRQE